MKLDITCMRYLTKDDYRVLQAVEMGMRNHELVPVPLITQIAKLRHGGSYKILSTLLKFKLVAHENTQYDAYRLSYMGYDILALRTLLSRGVVKSLGAQIGVGKESDIFEAQDAQGNEIVLKIHRLGRTSFRAVRKLRDYTKGKCKTNWLYMSRLAATKEYAFMNALHAHGFPTPTPIDHNRHVVAMSRIDGFPMCQVKSGNMLGAEQYFHVCMDLLRRLTEHGLVHCDFNEFNLMIGNDGSVTMIDFPQMVPTSHANAKELFLRDVNGLVKFFAMKMRFIPPEEAIPNFEELTSEATSSSEMSTSRIIHVEGLSASEDDVLLHYLQEQDADGMDENEGEGEDDRNDSDYEEEEQDGDGGDFRRIEENEEAVDDTAQSSTVVEKLKEDEFEDLEGLEEQAEAPLLEQTEESEKEEEETDETEIPLEIIGELRAKVKQRAQREAKNKQNRWVSGSSSSRNATKKRNKYGKIDKSGGKVDLSGW